MGVIVVFLIQLAVASPLWYAAVQQYGGWPTATIFLVQCVIQAGIQSALEAAK
jgi:hypothetical protein